MIINHLFGVAEWIFDAKAGRAGAAREHMAQFPARVRKDEVSIAAYFFLAATFRRTSDDNPFVFNSGQGCNLLEKHFGANWGSVLASDFAENHPHRAFERLVNGVCAVPAAVLEALERNPAQLLAPSTLAAMREAEAAAAPPPAPSEPVPATDPTPAALAPVSAATSSPRIRTSTTPVSGLDRVIAALRRTPSR